MKTKITNGAQAVIKFNNKMFGIVFLHDFLGSPYDYKYFIEKAENDHFSYYIPRYPGHGTTVDDLSGTNYNFWKVCAREAYIEMESHCDRIYLVGHGMGACFATELAVEFKPEKVFLLSTPYSIDDKKINFPYMNSKTIESIYENPETFGINDPEEAKKYIGYKNNIPAKIYNEYKKAVNNTKKILKDFNSEVMIIQSKDDELIAEDSAKQIHESIISIRKKIINLKDSNHIIMLDTGRDELIEGIFNSIKDN